MKQIGSRFGSLTIESIGDGRRLSANRWLKKCVVRCDCGTVKEVDFYAVHALKSCGCSKQSQENRDRMREIGRRPKTHGMSGTPEHSSWAAMKGRCLNPGDSSFARYGGRGITVCDRWKGPGGLEKFVADLGKRPPGTTLDRIDVNGNYEPGNCRWATVEQQARNHRDTKLSLLAAVLIREMFRRGSTKPQLARVFDVHPNHIGMVIYRRMWSDAVAQIAGGELLKVAI